MPIFKLSNKIILKHIITIFFTFVLFSVLSIFIGKMSFSDGIYEVKKSEIAIINNDSDSQVIESINEVLTPYSEFIEIENQSEKIKEALYYSKVDVILIIPKGYSEKFFTSERMEIEIMSLPDAFAKVQIENTLESFVKTVKVYSETLGYTDELSLSNAVSDLGQQVQTETLKSTKTKELYGFKVYSSFALMALFSVMGNMILFPFSAINKHSNKCRLMCAPISQRRKTLETFLSISMFTIIAFVIYIMLAAVVFGFGTVFSAQGGWMILSDIILSISMISVVILIMSFVKKDQTISFIATIVSLAMCFAGGAFVPQSMIGTPLKIIGKMTPGWWFIENLETAYNSISLTNSAISSMLANMGIMLALAVGYLLIGFVILKIKNKNGVKK